MPTEDQVRAAVTTYVDAINRRDRDAFLAVWRDDAIWYDPVPTGFSGSTAIAERFDSVFETATALTLSPVRVIVGGDQAAMVYEATFDFGQGPNVMDVAGFFTVDDDGRIAEMRAFLDLGSMRPGA